MVDYAKVPNWLLSIIAQKQAKGYSLTREEGLLLDNREAPPVPGIFASLEASDPKQLKDLLEGTELGHHENYRENYNILNLFLLAKKRKLLGDFGTQPEDGAYVSARRKCNAINILCKGATAAALVLFNIAYTVPKWRSVGLLLPLVGNVSLLSSAFMLTSPLIKQYQEKLLVAHADVANVRRNYLLSLLDNQQLIYRFEPAAAEFPPNPLLGIERKVKDQERRLNEAKEFEG